MSAGGELDGTPKSLSCKLHEEEDKRRRSGLKPSASANARRRYSRSGGSPLLTWLKWEDFCVKYSPSDQRWKVTNVSRSGILSHRSKVNQQRIFRNNAAMTHFDQVTTSLKTPSGSYFLKLWTSRATGIPSSLRLLGP